jgi:hypothetical protein
MPFGRHPSFAIACAGLLVLGRAAADEPPATSAPAESAGEAAAPNPVPRVVLVIVTGGASERELEALLTELLGRDGVALAFEHRSDFNPREVVSPSSAGSDAGVFIDLRDPSLVRLYFRSPDGERFLVRSLVLASGVDDLGREQLGQVVESSTLALLHSRDGLNRQQAESAIEAVRPEPVKALPATKAPPVEPPPAAPASKRSVWHGDVALRYGFELLGDAIDVRHGPGLELAAGQSLLGARLTLEHGFTQAVHAPEFSATEQVESVRLAAELGLPVAARQRAAVAVGGGIDVAHFDPGTPSAPDVTPSEPHTHVVPILRGELRYELAFAPMTLTAAAFTDIACEKTHYDVSEDGSVHRVASLNTVRPGGVLAFGFRFGL